MLTGFGGFAQALDEIGGLTVDLRTGRRLHEDVPGRGAAASTGREALRIARTRKSLQNGDFGRSGIKGCLISSAGAVPEGVRERRRVACSLARGGLRNVRTSLSIGELSELALRRDDRRPRWRHEPRGARAQRHGGAHVDRAAVSDPTGRSTPT